VITAALAWLALAIVFTTTAPGLVRRVRPAVAVRLVVACALAVTGAGVFVLSSIAFTWLAQHPDVARAGDWSTQKLHATDPIPVAVAIMCTVLVTAAAASLGYDTGRRLRGVRAVRAAVRLHTGPGDVIVVDDERPDAFATPGRHGRIVVTSGLMNALTPPEQRVILAHERSHLRHRHSSWLAVMHAVTGANPLLRRTAHAIGRAVERWADEDAAAAVGDRRLVAHTLARASLLRKHGTAAVWGTLAATGGDVPARVRALLAPPSTRGRVATVVLLFILLGAAVTAVMMQRTADALFDAAQR
jgi:Zn-dependent protease with chaperone function